MRMAAAWLGIAVAGLAVTAVGGSTLLTAVGRPGIVIYLHALLFGYVSTVLIWYLSSAVPQVGNALSFFTIRGSGRPADPGRGGDAAVGESAPRGSLSSGHRGRAVVERIGHRRRCATAVGRCAGAGGHVDGRGGGRRHRPGPGRLPRLSAPGAGGPAPGRQQRRMTGRSWIPLGSANLAGLAMLAGYPAAAIVLAALWVLDFARRVIAVRR